MIIYNKICMNKRILETVTHHYFSKYVNFAKSKEYKYNALTVIYNISKESLLECISQIDNTFIDAFEIKYDYLAHDDYASIEVFRIKIKIRPTVNLEELIGLMLILGIWKK